MERTNFYDAVYSPVILILNAIVVAVVMLLSASGNQSVLTFFGMSAGTAVAVINYISQIFTPVESLGMEIQTIQSAVAGIHRINEFLALEEKSQVVAEGNMEVLKDEMLKNHGYYRIPEQDKDTCVISADCGVYLFTPPAKLNESWEIIQLIHTPASDAVLVELDEDGEKELGVLSPFHGDVISIYKKIDSVYQKVYEYEKTAEFTHAIYGGMLCGHPAAVIGHRKGERNLIAFSWNKAEKKYQAEIIDRDCGPANVFHYMKDGADRLIYANREIDEVALYTLS